MAASPVVIDDGGSTRIKQLIKPGVDGEMDGLQGAGRQDAPEGMFNSVKVLWIDPNGPTPKESSRPDLGPLDTVHIDSATGQTVDLAIDIVRKCTITLGGSCGGVDKKLLDDQPRYIATGAGAIEKVTLTRTGEVLFDSASMPSIYTAVLLFP